MRKAFTLIELLAVLTIISILVGMFFVNSQMFVDKARDTRVKEQLYALRQAIHVYKTDHKGNSPEAINLLYPDYIMELNLSWEGSAGEGMISYDPFNGTVSLIVERGKPVDSQGEEYVSY